MTSFYTRNGDDGYTGLLGQSRVPKYHPRIEALGAVDEATAALGLARTISQSARTASLLLTVQRDLYHVMTELATPLENAALFRKVDSARVAWLEEQTDTLSLEVELPSEFIIPGDSPAGAAMAFARTVVRRAERQVAALLHLGEIENAELLHYLNRLSSLCFILELIENGQAGKSTPTLAKG